LSSQGIDTVTTAPKMCLQSNVPLGFMSRSENLVKVGMGVCMLLV
jgi:hypothetical protein